MTPAVFRQLVERLRGYVSSQCQCGLLDLIRTGYRYPPDFQAASFCCSGIALHSGCCSARRARLGDLVELAGLDVIDEAVNRDVFRHQGMTANSLDILGDAFGVVIEGVPVDVVTGDGAAAVLRIRRAARLINNPRRTKIGHVEAFPVLHMRSLPKSATSARLSPFFLCRK